MTMPLFDGPCYEQREERDERLGKQFKAVRDLMLDGEWRSLRQIAATLGYPESSVSARLRDMRKPKFGGYVVERRHVERGLYLYRVQEYKNAIERKAT